MRIDAHMIVRLSKGTGTDSGKVRVIFYNGKNSTLDSLSNTAPWTYLHVSTQSNKYLGKHEVIKFESEVNCSLLEFWSDSIFPNFGVVRSADTMNAIIFKRLDLRTLEIFAFKEAYGYHLLFLQVMIDGRFDGYSGPGTKARRAILTSPFNISSRVDYNNNVMLTKLI